MCDGSTAIASLPGDRARRVLPFLTGQVPAVVCLMLPIDHIRMHSSHTRIFDGLQGTSNLSKLALTP